MKQFLEDIYEGYTFKDVEQFNRGVDKALKEMTPEEIKKVKDTFGTETSGIYKLREILGKKYDEEIKEEIDWLENNLTEENEWDFVYMMNLHEFYAVI